MVDESTWRTVILIPKGVGDYCGIGLVKVVLKVVLVIISLWLTSSIIFNNVLHGFQAGCGTVTASLKAKLRQQLASMREEVLYAVFMDLHKVYEALDRDGCL